MKELPEEMIRTLIRKAIAMQQKSYIPYSGFAVGSALLTKNGTIYTGCNIENRAFSPSLCSERTAFAKAVSEGETEFAAIAVAGGRGRKPEGFCMPCGVCRQVMLEFCDPEEFLIISAQSEDLYKTYTLAELLPAAFVSDLDENV